MLYQMGDLERRQELAKFYEVLRIIPTWREDVLEAGWESDWVDYMEQLDKAQKLLLSHSLKKRRAS